MGHGRRGIALAYPSPYPLAMSSLGFQQVYRLLNQLPDTVAERAFLPDAEDTQPGSVLTYESTRPLADFGVVAISVACETEILGVFTLLERSGLPLLARERGDSHPWVVCGGPLTFSNPRPLAPFADVIVVGEAETLLAPLCDLLFSQQPRAAILRRFADMPGFYVPVVHGELVPELVHCGVELLPAASVVRTPEATLASMDLVEIERGCARECTFCVMRRNQNHGQSLRLVPAERVLACVPADARRVGLVGAAVTDHPELVTIVSALAARGCQVGLSSLRADRLTSELATLLVGAGAKTLTVAADGASERLRQSIGKHIEARHLLHAAELARELGLAQLKCYVMVGLPGETLDDIDELAALTLDLASTAGKHTRVVLGASTFVPKLNTPLATAPFVGTRQATTHLDRLRRKITPQVELRSTSPRWAWVEYMLAQGESGAGLQALAAWRAGGDIRAFRAAFLSA